MSQQDHAADLRSGSMLEYQQHLLKVAGSSSVSNVQEAFVAVRLGEQSWLVDLSLVQEALAPPRMARIASAPRWVAGVVGVRGQVWSVIDMLSLSPDEGVESHLARPRGWMTLLRDPPDHPGHRIALLWSDMVEVATKRDYTLVDPSDTNDPDVAAIQSSPWSRALWKDIRGQMWRELDVTQILGEQGLVSSWHQRPDVHAAEA